MLFSMIKDQYDRKKCNTIVISFWFLKLLKLMIQDQEDHKNLLVLCPKLSKIMIYDQEDHKNQAVS